MQPKATYNRLNVLGGAEHGAVIGTGERAGPSTPSELAKGAPSGSAFINGGYFVHKDGLETDRGTEIPSDKKGLPVGETASRPDFTPVPEPWTGDYGNLKVGGRVGLGSGPLLALNGDEQILPHGDDRFKYRDANGGPNPLNKRAGALTHASDANERSAISVKRDGAGNGNTVLHTLTAPDRKDGVTMKQWQAITSVGVRTAHGEGAASTLNLDGGGSVSMGIRSAGETRTIAQGGGNADVARPVANIVATKPTEKRLKLKERRK